MPADNPAAYGQNIARSAMNLNPITGAMDFAQQGGQQLMNLLPILMQFLGQQQAPQGNPLSGVGAPGAMQGGMQGAIPLKQKMVPR